MPLSPLELKLQSLNEAELTERIVMPLFGALGYSRVQYNGGPNEGGKDVICQRTGELGDLEIAAIQVKKTKAKAAAASQQSFSEIVTQLQQAKEKKIALLDGSRACPDFVFFVTPFELDVRALESRFEAYESISKRGAKVIDGVKLVQLIRQKLPDLETELLGAQVLQGLKGPSAAANQELLGALRYSGTSDVNQFYCDLDFGMGRVTTKIFASLDFEGSALQASFSPSDWYASILPLLKEAEEILGQSIVKPGVVDVISEYQRNFDKWNNPQNQQLLARVAKSAAEIDALSDGLHKSIETYWADFIQQDVGVPVSARDAMQAQGYELSKPVLDLLLSLKHLATSSRTSASRLRDANAKKQNQTDCKQVLGLTKKIQKQLKDLRGELKDFDDKKDHFLSVINDVPSASLAAKNQSQARASRLTNLASIIEIAAELQKKLEAHQLLVSERQEEPQYLLEIQGAVLANCLRAEQQELNASLDRLNATEEIGQAELRTFCGHCKRLFSVVDRLLSRDEFCHSIGHSANTKYASLERQKRISFPIGKIFDSGLSCLIVGEAGAGKTTTLQMYAAKRLNDASQTRSSIFLPLNRLVSNLKIEDEPDFPKLSDSEKFDFALVQYACSQGVEVSKAQLLAQFAEPKLLQFILDGADEVEKSAPWVLSAIRELPSRFPNSQILLSARASGQYLGSYDFLSITLLPFTDAQLADFIRGWFKSSRKTADDVLSHLAKSEELAAVVRNPLLATMLCVLAEMKVPLPNTDLGLYKERLELLLGQYDIHKQAKRLTSHRQILEMVARKLAFKLHAGGLRSEHRDQLHEMALDEIPITFASADAIKTAVDELIDPANILIPMTESGEFGFGHLSHQEYLAATELCLNRGREISNFLGGRWWQSALVMFSRLTDQLLPVLEGVLADCDSLDDKEATLKAMLAVRPASERRRLETILREFIQFHEHSSVLDNDVGLDAGDDLNEFSGVFRNRDLD